MLHSHQEQETSCFFCFFFLPLQDNGPAVGKRPVPHAAGGSPVDSRQALSLQHCQPSRPHASSSADAALPLQLSGLHISPSQRYDACGVSMQRECSLPLTALCLHPAENRRGDSWGGAPRAPRSTGDAGFGSYFVGQVKVGGKAKTGAWQMPDSEQNSCVCRSHKTLV